MDYKTGLDEEINRLSELELEVMSLLDVRILLCSKLEDIYEKLKLAFLEST
jgi:hypothetical protein